MLPSVRTIYRFITAATLLFIAEMVAVHILYHDRTFTANPLSIYALGEYGYLMTSGFLFSALNYFLLAALFWKAGDTTSAAFRVGIVLMILLGLDTVVIALFPADFGAIVSVCGWIHEIAAYMHFIVLPVAVLTLRCGLRADTFTRYNRVGTAFVLLLISIGLAIVWDTCFRDSDHWSGVLQKLLILIIQLWVLYTSWKLISAIEEKTAAPAISPTP